MSGEHETAFAFDGDRLAITALAAWGLQTLLHAVGIAARETGVHLAGHPNDLSQVERSQKQVERMLQEARRECGNPKRIDLLVYSFTRRVFEAANEYLPERPEG